MKILELEIVRRNSLGLNKSQAIWLCIGITLFVMVVELFYSYVANSLMLFSDGLHMFSHAASLGISLSAIYIAERTQNDKVESWAALINGIGLIGFTIYIFIESYLRLMSPEVIEVNSTFVVAIIGLIVNLLTAWILSSTGVEDLNTKSAFLHMLADTFSSVAIILGTVVIIYTDWFWIDAILSAVVAYVVGKWSIDLISQAWKSLRNA